MPWPDDDNDYNCGRANCLTALARDPVLPKIQSKSVCLPCWEEFRALVAHLKAAWPLGVPTHVAEKKVDKFMGDRDYGSIKPVAELVTYWVTIPKGCDATTD